MNTQRWGKGLRIVKPDTQTAAPPTRQGLGTATSSFGGPGVRENHDSTEFYARFDPVKEADPSRLVVNRHVGPDEVRVGDARATGLDDNVAAMVVTSPPYFAGKAYEVEDDSPQTWDEYLSWLGDVLAESYRILESGGRLAVNVSGGLGRRPYVSLSAEVIRLLESAGFLLRGEIIWVKAEGSSSMAVGTWGSPHNPVLRDVTERVIVASKDTFHRVGSQSERRAAGQPSEFNMSSAEFAEATLDVWRIQPARASQVGHPAPFPVELPKRLIELYTFGGDLVVDPMCGSGSTGVACVETGRRFVGIDKDNVYVDLARRRMGKVSQSLQIPPPAPVAGRLNLSGSVEETSPEVSEGQLELELAKEASSEGSR